MVDETWPLWRRVLFRFGFVAAVLFVYPAPLGIVPGTDALAQLAARPWTALVVWLSQLLGAGTPTDHPTGSGDTLLAWMSFVTLLTVAALATAVWSMVDRKRLSYPRLAVATWVGLRYMLAFTLLSYGFAKIVNTQFPTPDPLGLDRRVGDISPMSMLWTFQGASGPYTIFGGLCEALAATLLLFRRTATLGALLAIGVMTNVVMLNLCYDVPVKLFSSQLLAIAIVIALPQLRRILRVLLGYAVAEVPPRARSSIRVERARLVAKVLVLALFAYNLHTSVEHSLEYRWPPNELHGAWQVERYSVGGVDRPAVVTDRQRWCRLLVSPYAISPVNCADQRNPARAYVLPSVSSIVVAAGEVSQLWAYHLDGNHLTLDFDHVGSHVHVEATRRPEPLLLSRGFHLVQEYPFNR